MAPPEPATRAPAASPSVPRSLRYLARASVGAQIRWCYLIRYALFVAGCWLACRLGAEQT